MYWEQSDLGLIRSNAGIYFGDKRYLLTHRGLPLVIPDLRMQTMAWKAREVFCKF